VETGILDQGDRNTFRRVRFLAQQARTFESARPESLRAFVTWLERQAGQQILDNEGAGVDDDEDAVRILTVHGAKGLEFPIVFLAGLAAAPNRNREPYLRDYSSERVAIRAGTSGGNRLFTLGDYGDLYESEKIHDAAEFDRVLYVAATRARDHLVISLHYGAKTYQSAAQRLIEHGARDNALEQQIKRAPTGARSRPFDRMTLEIPDIAADQFKKQREALVIGARRREYTSATAIKTAQAERAHDDQPEREDETEPWSRGRAATRVGRAVHAAIQSLPLDASAGTIAAFARAQAVAEAVPHRTADVERLVRWVLGCDAWRRAQAASRAIREVPFALEIDAKVLEGFIDLVIETTEGVEIVDWKTDNITAAQVDERMRDYELQAGLYVYGLETATGRHVHRVTYVFAGPGVERSPGDPAALATAAVERLKTAAP
jgi:ATP-dependent helicase/nuclease subunit A